MAQPHTPAHLQNIRNAAHSTYIPLNTPLDTTNPVQSFLELKR